LERIALHWGAGRRHATERRRFQIVQRGGYVVFLYEYGHTYRVVPLDGRAHLPSSIKLWMGDMNYRAFELMVRPPGAAAAKKTKWPPVN
jgi:hypothetical protein